MAEASAQAFTMVQRRSVKYVKGGHPVALDKAAEYFSDQYPKAFLVNEGVYSNENERVENGDIIVAYVKKAVSFLTLKPLVSSPGSEPVSIPDNTPIKFALIPTSDVGNDTETDEAIWSWERKFHSVTDFLDARKEQPHSTTMPAALKVLDDVTDSKRQRIKANTILFNIEITKAHWPRRSQGIAGVDHKGVVHKFYESNHRLHFSTKLVDVKCSPLFFARVLKLPQMARVYLDADAELASSLHNLSTVMFTSFSQSHNLMVRKVSDTGDDLGLAFTIPLNAELEVAAIEISKYDPLYDKIAQHQRQVKLPRTRSCPDLGSFDFTANGHEDPYSGDPMDLARNKLQEMGDHDSYNTNPKLKKYAHGGSFKATATFTDDEDFVQQPILNDSESDGEEDITEDLEDSGMAALGMPTSRKLPSNPGGTSQPLDVPGKNWRLQRDQVVSEVASAKSPSLKRAWTVRHPSFRLPHNGRKRMLVLGNNIYDYEDYLIVLREHVSRKAAGKGKAVLEGVGLDAHVINACFCDNPGCEEEAVHTGLQKWILEGQGSQPATWEVLLDAMKHAFIGIPHIQSLRELLGLPKE